MDLPSIPLDHAIKVSHQPPKENVRGPNYLFWLWVGALFLVGFGGAMAFYGGQELFTGTILLVNGEPFTATVTGKDYSPGDDDSGPTYYVDYKYRVRWPNGEPEDFYGRSEVSADVYDEVFVEGPVNITYWPLNPNISLAGDRLRAPIGRLALSLLILGLVGLPMTLFGLALLRFAIVGAWKAIRLRFFGRIARARVAHLWEEVDGDGDTIGGFIGVLYEATLDGGRRDRFYVGEQKLSLAKQLERGQEVLIKYDPADPTKNFRLIKPIQ